MPTWSKVDFEVLYIQDIQVSEEDKKYFKKRGLATFYDYQFKATKKKLCTFKWFIKLLIRMSEILEIDQEIFWSNGKWK